jgi:cytochrome c biogenesis protein CcmG/thiol:disulfide interchange protein DsbE
MQGNALDSVSDQQHHDDRSLTMPSPNSTMTRHFPPMRARWCVCLPLILIAAGCGGQSPSNPARAPDYGRSLHGAPPQLLALYKKTEYGKQPTVLPGGMDALNAELSKLRGHPAVVNVWGEWCGPCREEFPFLQKESAAFGARVAFVGVDALDEMAAAKALLEEDPLPYPSFFDHPGDAKGTYDLVGLPATIFYSRTGTREFVHQGAYTSASALAADITRYAH